jgi:hypothetical protein
MLCVDKLKVLLKAAREKAVVPPEGFDHTEGGEGSDAGLISPVTVTTQATSKSKNKQKKRIGNEGRRKIAQKKGPAPVSTAKPLQIGSTAPVGKRLSDQFAAARKDDDGFLVSQVRVKHLSLYACM